MAERVDTLIKQLLYQCPGPVYGKTHDDIWEIIQNVIGNEYPLHEIGAAMNRAGYLPQYRMSADGDAYYCLQLPDISWRAR